MFHLNLVTQGSMQHTHIIIHLHSSAALFLLAYIMYLNIKCRHCTIRSITTWMSLLVVTFLIYSTLVVLSIMYIGDKMHMFICVYSIYAFCILQDCPSVQPKPECGLHCGYLACLPAGDHTWHWLQSGVRWSVQWLVPDQVVAGCHSLHTGVRLHTSTDIQSLLHTQEHQSGSKQRQNQGI